MTIQLSYKYSDLDEDHQFGLEFIGATKYDEIYIRWVYFYLGLHTTKKPSLYPFKNGTLYKTYKHCNDAERQAKLILNAINKQLKAGHQRP